MAVCPRSFAPVFENDGRTEIQPTKRILSMTFDAFFIAVLLLMTFVPNLGYHRGDAFYFVYPYAFARLAWRCARWCRRRASFMVCLRRLLLYPGPLAVRALMPCSPSLGRHPAASILRLAAGLLFAFCWEGFPKEGKGLYLALGSALLTFLHTGLVFLDLYVFFPAEIGGLFSSPSPVATRNGPYLLLGHLDRHGGEMAVAAFIVPPLYLATLKDCLGSNSADYQGVSMHPNFKKLAKNYEDLGMKALRAFVGRIPSMTRRLPKRPLMAPASKRPRLLPA